MDYVTNGTLNLDTHCFLIPVSKALNKLEPIDRYSFETRLSVWLHQAQVCFSKNFVYEGNAYGDPTTRLWKDDMGEQCHDFVSQREDGNSKMVLDVNTS